MDPRLEAILRQRCPVCLTGDMFRSLVDLHEHCPVCGHRFMREAGYFQGAMYVSYVLALGSAALLLLAAHKWLGPHIGIATASILAIAAQMVLVIPMYRYSRVIWAHLNIGTQSHDQP